MHEYVHVLLEEGKRCDPDFTCPIFQLVCGDYVTRLSLSALSPPAVIIIIIFGVMAGIIGTIVLLAYGIKKLSKVSIRFLIFL